MKWGRPTPSDATIQAVLKKERVRNAWGGRQLFYVYAWLLSLLPFGMFFPLAMNALDFTFSPKHLESGHVVMLVQFSRSSETTPVVFLQGRQVQVSPSPGSDRVKAGGVVQVWCSPRLSCRMTRDLPLDELLMMVLLYGGSYLLLARPLLQFWRRDST